MKEPIILGIIAGILTAIIIYLVGKFWYLYIIPVIRKILCKEPDINGDWKTFDEEDDKAEQVGKAYIIQKGERITIKIERFKRRSDHSPTLRKLIYNGKFVSGTMITLYNDEKMKHLIIGSMVLRISTDNQKLSGKVTYYDQNEAKVVAKDYFLIKDK